eukprot:335223-Chlamydomonas_euryale.AAC.1
MDAMEAMEAMDASQGAVGVAWFRVSPQVRGVIILDRRCGRKAQMRWRRDAAAEVVDVGA